MAYDYLEEIRNKIDIVEFIGQYVKLQKAGANYKALCPFHKEKTPSFFVSPSRQIFHCFGCGAGGDVITFLMKIENLDFKDAVKILAEKAGVKITYEKPELQELKNKLLEIHKKATEFYQQQLLNNFEALNYLKKRGLKNETLETFKLGFAPDEWRGLTNFLIKKGFSPKDLVSSGLAISKINLPEEKLEQIQLKESDIYDRFRSRIMFPIEDITGNIVAFTGRIFEGTKALKTIKDIEAIGKYINSPQTLIFDKSKILYGLSKTKTFLHSLESTLLVEGQMDFLMGYQSGIKNIVATSGTSLTSYHLTILKKYNNNLILGFDMDEAGMHAKERGIELALNKEFNIKILQLPQGKDLADYLLENQVNSNEKTSELLKNAIPIMDFYFERAKTMGKPDTLEGKKTIIAYFLPKIKKLGNPVDKAFWLEKLSQYINIDIKALEDELKKIPLDQTVIIDENESLSSPLKVSYSPSYSPSEQLGSIVNYNRLEVIAERVLALMLKNFKFKNILLEYQDYFPSNFQIILDLFLKTNNLNEFKKENLQNNNISPEIIDKINLLFLKADYEEELLNRFNIEIREEITKQLMILKNESIKEKLKNLEIQIKEAEKNNDKELMAKLLSQFNLLSKQLKKYN
ncbi:MAG: DNA primase [Minisyncoccia bacterium]